MVHDPSSVCCRLNYGMVWDHLVTTKTACVRTAHTLHLNLKVCVARSGRVCGLATHAVDRGAGYGLLTVVTSFRNSGGFSLPSVCAFVPGIVRKIHVSMC